MVKRIAMGVGGVIWFVLVFLITLRLTFPGDAVGDRLRVEVHNATTGQNELMLSGVRPWSTGLAADNVALLAVGRARAGEEPDKDVLVSFDSAWVKAGLFSMLRNAPRLSGGVAIGASEVDFDVTLGMNKRGTELSPKTVLVSAPGIRVSDLVGLAGGGMETTGDLDLDVDVRAGESMRDAEGDIRLSGNDIVILSLDPELTQGMDLGREIPLDEVDIHLAIREGVAEFRNGRIQSPLADLELEGDISLRDDLARSGMNITIKADLGEELAMFKTFLKSAEQSNGEFHYTCSGLVSRPSCRAARASSSARSTTAAGIPRPRTERGERSTSAEDRDRRKDQIERLKANAERRKAEREEARGEPDPDEGEELEEIGYEEGEEELDEEGEEPLDEEDLGLEEDEGFE